MKIDTNQTLSLILGPKNASQVISICPASVSWIAPGGTVSSKWLSHVSGIIHQKRPIFILEETCVMHLVIQVPPT